MRYLPVVFVLLFTAPLLGQTRGAEKASPDERALFASIVKRLREALISSSHHDERKFLLQAQKLARQLPQSPVSERLKDRIERALKAGMAGSETDTAVREAIEIAEAAEKVLAQPSPSVDPEAAKAVLMRVLSSPEFRDLFAPIRRLLQRVLAWLEKPAFWVWSLLERVFEPIRKILQPILKWLAKALEVLGAWLAHLFQLLASISPILAWTVVVLLGAVGLTSLVLAILSWWRRRQKALAQVAVVESLAVPEQLLHEAEIAARSGDYLTAIRKAYRALLLLLDRIGLIRFREQRTNWEYLAEIRKKAPTEFARRFQEVTGIFDICFYARKFATASEFAAVKQFAEEARTKAHTSLDLKATEEVSPQT